MLNLATLLEDSARRHPDRDAVVLGTTRLDYRSLDALANQVANLLVSRGVRPGDKVALSCPNTPQFPAVYYGILKAGAVVVPLNVMLKAREVAYHLTDSEAKAYFCFEGTPELPMGAEGWKGFQQAAGCDTFLAITAGPVPQHAPEGAELLTSALGEQPTSFDTVVREATDSAVILYTSGTTGHPKGAELSHANLVLNALTCNRQFGVVDHDVHLVTLPLFHSFGSTVQMNAGLGVGATLVLLPRFDAGQALALLEREKVTFFAGVPTMYWGLLGALARDADVDVDAIAARLRVAVSGGASLPVEIIREFRDRFGVQVLEGYGLSETSPLATFADPARDPRPGSIGVPVWGVECRLVDEDWNTLEGADVVGEIAVKGHNVMKGYHNRPEATAEVMRDGWFRTGDLARRDEDGFYYIVDRAKDLIIRGGFNVYPREVEEVLMTHADVSLAAVIGVPHDSHGEEVKAVVIPREGAAVTEGELLAWGKEQMAAYKYPRIVEFVDTLPMTATGKILKRELAARP
ncbi:long-chain-fatty-acid--CoA ligase [Nocardioides sediminis]|uniref:long-chain-fatty-acid--CoA ligase n=1 Tax=Nocardioides sediminis TaxID=433648 RepID=UPI000D31F0A7|nr:long-chain fatty acid--CoA ligase [Nocardioides sediminis]